MSVFRCAKLVEIYSRAVEAVKWDDKGGAEYKCIPHKSLSTYPSTSLHYFALVYHTPGYGGNITKVLQYFCSICH